MNMPTSRIDVAFRAFGCAALLVTLLGGCGKSAAPDAVPAPPASREVPAPNTAPDTAPAPANPAETPAAPAQPAPDAPPPIEPSATPTPAANNEPALESMHAARASAKISVPVDLRYQFDGPVLPNQPVMLRLAAVPRIAGSHLKVSVKSAAGLRADAAPLNLQKVNAAGVYRQQVSITATEGAPTEIRVLVTMDMAEGSGFGFFTVPIANGTAAQKLQSVKQR
jgi:hypothetical protein